MEIITTKDELIKFCRENAIDYSCDYDRVYIERKRIIGTWAVGTRDKIVYTKTGFKNFWTSRTYDDCLTVKLKNCLAIIQTTNEIIAISKNIIDKDINSMWECDFRKF